MITPVRIQRKRTKGWRMPENTLYVGRPTKWGNPFHGHWDVPAEMFRVLLKETSGIALTQAERLRIAQERKTYKLPDVSEIRGKNLACWCPLTDKDGNHVPCHADVLLELANA